MPASTSTPRNRSARRSACKRRIRPHTLGGLGARSRRGGVRRRDGRRLGDAGAAEEGVLLHAVLARRQDADRALRGQGQVCDAARDRPAERDGDRQSRRDQREVRPRESESRAYRSVERQSLDFRSSGKGRGRPDDHRRDRDALSAEAAPGRPVRDPSRRAVRLQRKGLSDAARRRAEGVRRPMAAHQPTRPARWPRSRRSGCSEGRGRAPPGSTSPPPRG